MKTLLNERPPKQMTVFIDADLYEAPLIAKARGKGSLKKQINEVLRRTLRMQSVAELEEQERCGWEAKPRAGRRRSSYVRRRTRFGG